MIMGLIAKQDGISKDYDPMPAGNHHAVCFGVVDLGTQKTEYMGEPKNVRKVVVLWEVPNVRVDVTDENGDVTGDIPRFIRKEYTLSLNEKATLYKDLISWRGRDFTAKELEGFDLKKIITVNCLLNVVHKTSKTGNKYGAVAGLSPLLANIEPLKPEREILYYSLDDHGMNIPENIYEFMRKQILQSIEFTSNDGLPDLPSADDIPF